MHGNAVAALACHSEFILPTNFTNFTNVYRCAIGFSPTDYTDFIAARWFLPTNFTNITNIYCYVIVFFLQILLNGRTSRASQRGGVVYMNIFL